MTTDQKRGTRIPVGVAAWDSQKRWYDVRTIAPDERVSGITKSRQFLLSTMESQIRRWAEKSDVPYADHSVHPWSTEFWKSVKDVTTASIRVDSPRAMEPMQEPDVEFDFLFEAIVQPRQERSRRLQRIDSALKQALGPWDERLTPRANVRAYGGTEETVFRAAETSAGLVLIEGVNLAGSNAKHDADALVSKIQRILQAYEDRSVVDVLVGYCASPGGLNGESHMRDWIMEKVATKIFDVGREQDELRTATKEALAVLESQFDLLTLR